MNDNEHPVHALAVAEAIRIPRNIAQQEPPCFFTSPGPALELEIVTDPEEFEATIGSDPVAMPEPVFEVTSSRAEQGMTYRWALELSYEEGNYANFAEEENVSRRKDTWRSRETPPGPRTSETRSWEGRSR